MLPETKYECCRLNPKIADRNKMIWFEKIRQKSCLYLTLSMHLVVLVFILRNMVIRAGVFSLKSRGYTERKIIQTLEHQDYKEASGPSFDVAIGILDKVENMRLHSFL